MRFVIVGAGLAGHRAATHLRELSADARITLVGEEHGLPYDRPPLSKEMLTSGGAKYLASQAAYDASAIDYRPGQTVISIDRAASQVRTASGDLYAYDRLLLATGSRPRRLPDHIARTGDVIYLRTLADATRLETSLGTAKRVAIIGGGFIGLEVAAAARAKGIDVIVLEMAPRLIPRAMPAVLAEWLHAEHLARGVSIQLDATVHSILNLPDGRLRLDWNTGSVDADAVIAGIGIQPNVELAAAAGLSVEDGIVVDERCRTSDPRIFAAGEVTSHPDPSGLLRRLESWRLAADQSLVAAKSMLDQDCRYSDPPWLWSDQFGHNIQSLGVPTGPGDTLMLGDPGTDRWTAIFRDPHGRIAGAVAVNNGRDIAILKRAMIKDGRVPDALMARAAAHGQAIQQENA